MRITPFLILLTIFFATGASGQINEGLVIVSAVRSVEFSRAYDEAGREYDKKPGVEIELFSAAEYGFYLGMVNAENKFIEHSPQCLLIEGLKPIVEGGSGGRKIPHNRIRYFVIDREDWRKLKDGAELRIRYGCPASTDYRDGYFARLDKSLLDKPAPSQCALPLEFAPKLKTLGLGFSVHRIYERVYFNERKDSRTNVLTLSYTGAENAEKIPPEYNREYLREFKTSPSAPEIIYGIERMDLSVADDVIFRQEITYSEPLKNGSIRAFVEAFAEKWRLPDFWKRSANDQSAELTCGGFKVLIDQVNSNPRVILIDTKKHEEVNARSK